MPIIQPKILSFKMINYTVCKKKNKEQQAKSSIYIYIY